MPNLGRQRERGSARRFLSRLYLVSAISCLAAAAAPSAERPNFVVILADDMGYGDASCYGNRDYETPHLDALAREGLRFTDFHSNGAVCSPTRAALLTGRYPQRAGVPGVISAGFDQNRHHGLQTNEVTFAELLRGAGYRTAIFGKWHLGYEPRYNPVAHGFDEFRGYVSGNIDYHSHFDRMGVADWWRGDQRAPEEGYSTRLITRHAIEFIEKNRSARFCLYIAHEAPHDPYQGPDDPPIRTAGRVVPNRYPPGRIPRAYREMTQEMDRGIGGVIQTLRRLELADRTLVLFFSDNGANANGKNDPWRGRKGSLWEGGHRVPAIAWQPGVIEPGETSALALGMDVMPTLLDFAGVPAPETRPLDGLSLRPLLLERAPLPERTVFWEYRNQGAARRGPWKLVINGNREELFRLDEDPSERVDLATRNPDRVESLRRAWDDWKKDAAAGATQQPERSE